MTIFKTIQLGKKPDLSKVKVSNWAEDLLEKVKYSKKKETIDLVKISVEELGFTEQTPLKEIYAKAKELGLELCPSEVGPQLRAQYLDQPMDEWFYVGMEPIEDSDGDLGVFGLGHNDDGLWLYSRHANPDYTWGPGRSLVFRLFSKSGTKTLESSDDVLGRLGVLEDFKSRVEKVLKLN